MRPSSRLDDALGDEKTQSQPHPSRPKYDVDAEGKNSNMITAGELALVWNAFRQHEPEVLRKTVGHVSHEVTER